MGDMALGYRDKAEVTKERQERHAQWKEKNTKTLDVSQVPYKVVNEGECYLFRVPGKVKADFYPSTGRWVVHSKGVKGRHNGRKTWSGGATKFLIWYMSSRGDDTGEHGKRGARGFKKDDV